MAIEVMNGCICCTVRGDLVEALKRMYDKVLITSNCYYSKYYSNQYN